MHRHTGTTTTTIEHCTRDGSPSIPASTSRANPNLSYPKQVLRSAPGPALTHPSLNPRSVHSRNARGRHHRHACSPTHRPTISRRRGRHRCPALPAETWPSCRHNLPMRAPPPCSGAAQDEHAHEAEHHHRPRPLPPEGEQSHRPTPPQPAMPAGPNQRHVEARTTARGRPRVATPARRLRATTSRCPAPAPRPYVTAQPAPPHRRWRRSGFARPRP